MSIVKLTMLQDPNAAKIRNAESPFCGVEVIFALEVILFRGENQNSVNRKKTQKLIHSQLFPIHYNNISRYKSLRRPAGKVGGSIPSPI
jgi:hypothetical protein